MRLLNAMIDDPEERLFLLEHKGTYYVPEKNNTTAYIKNLIDERLSEKYKGLCEPFVMLYDLKFQQKEDFKLAATVILRFDNSKDVNKFKVMFMNDLDNMVEITN